jgi:hypothetical protein
MNRNDRLERVRLIASQLFDGLASAEEQGELNELLRGDPELCELYLDLAEVHAQLVREHDGDTLAEESAGILPFEPGEIEFRKGRTAHRRSRTAPWLLFAAATLGLLALVPGLWRGMPQAEEVAEPSQAPGVAVISRVVDPEWGGDGVPVPGDALPAGELSLRSGLVQIEFFSGATLIVEGPAELGLESPWRVVCRSGRLRAFVPEPAQGFTVATADYEAVDLGTEFALSVGGDGRSEVHVLSGEVRLDGADGREMRHLGAGSAVRSSGGDLTEIEGRGEAFVDRQRLLELARDDWRSRYAGWKGASGELRRDPAALVLFDFEAQDPWDRELRNKAPGAPSGAAIIGAQWTQGRWPGKGALEFKRINDRVRLRVPGEFAELTLSAWVRAEGFERWLSSLMLTDGWETGEVHWQISDRGQLILGVSGGLNAFSEPVIHPRDLGRWMHLAATVEAGPEGGRIVHYLDGVAVGEVRSDQPMPPLRIGEAEIGNWQASDLVNPHPIRSLNGRIDDFLILSRALSPGEVSAIHAAGLPNG